MKEIGIYIHIPFCIKKCSYCDFISFDNREAKIDEYIASLKREIDRVGVNSSTYINYDPMQYKVRTIYIGGGTPSYLESRHIKEVLSVLKLRWNVDQDAEITLEMNPGTVDKDKLKAYRDLGINRLSIGLQSANNEELKIIDRSHTYEDFLEAYKLSEEAGFENINVDIILGLPNQTTKSLQITIDKVISLKPKHISVYSLILEEGTKLYEEISEHLLPDDNEERKLYWSTKKRVEEAGYKHYEISNYCLEGHESKHNLDCWYQKEYIGFGLGAHSYIDDRRYSNTSDLNEYIWSEGKQKTIHETQDKESKMKEYMLLGLRKIEGIKILEFKDRFEEDPNLLYRDELNILVAKGLIEMDDEKIKLTNKGIDLANQVWGSFL
ncbi:MAG: radical SAM family heme chaperone HemW [Oscillospiraceae bacterium]|nr:radical SAM family heme chaperone HemW [Oscillospiraceae bacterium]